MFKIRNLHIPTRLGLALVLLAGMLGVLPAPMAHAQPVLVVSGTVTYTGALLYIAPGLSLTGDTPNGASVSIGTNFDPTEDRLGVNGAQSGNIGAINYSYNSTTGIPTLSGNDTVGNYQSILQQVTYRNIGGPPTVAARTVDFFVGGGLYYSGTGHFYEFVSAPAIQWNNANVAAAARSYFGLQGYLATVTSAGENAFIASKLSEEGWMGSSDAATEGICNG